MGTQSARRDNYLSHCTLLTANRTNTARACVHKHEQHIISAFSLFFFSSCRISGRFNNNDEWYGEGTLIQNQAMMMMMRIRFFHMKKRKNKYRSILLLLVLLLLLLYRHCALFDHTPSSLLFLCVHVYERRHFNTAHFLWAYFWCACMFLQTTRQNNHPATKTLQQLYDLYPPFGR